MLLINHTNHVTMNTKQILKETKKMTFKQAIEYIKNTGFELILSENYPFLISFEIKNNNEVSRVSIYMKSLDCKMSDVKFTYLY